MSYILDALKKSEQDRGHGNVPGVQTIHSASINYRKEKKPVWPYILIIAVVINIGLMVYFNLDKTSPTNQMTGEPDKQTQSTTSSSVSADTFSETTTAKTAKPVAHNTESVTGHNPTVTAINNPPDNQPETFSNAKPPENKLANNSDDKRIAEKPSDTNETNSIPTERTPAETKHSTNQGSVVYDTDSVINFNELPPDIKAQLPAIIISAHVYSTNPQQRSIVINNNFMEEGEYLIDDIRLKEITPNGAILQYKGYTFRYGSISSWQ